MPLLRFLTRYFFIGEAMDYITKASQEIIKARRDGGSNTSTVGDQVFCIYTVCA